MENIVTVAVPEINLSDNNGVSATYPSLNRCFGFLSSVCTTLTDYDFISVLDYHICYLLWQYDVG